MSDLEPFGGKVALITGRDGVLGEAVAARLHDGGAHVVLAGENPCPTQAARVGIERMQFDVTQASHWASAITNIERRYGALHILINAACAYSELPLIDTSLETFDAVFAGTLESTWLGMRAAVPALRAVRGAIVNVVSIGGTRPSGFGGAYAVMGEGIITATRSVAVECGPTGPRANVVQTGRVWTAAHAPEPALLAECDELASVVAAIEFLASDAASMITGTTFRVDGGRAVS